MDRYQMVKKPRDEAPINENEIRVTSLGRTRNYITYAMSLFQEKGSTEVVIKGMGRAISKTIMIVELLKRRIAGLHQITKIESTDITDKWEPLEEGLNTLETTRHVSTITVTLSKKELDTSSLGYQPPISADQVKPWADNDDNEEPLPRSRGGGCGGRGRGRARGYNNGTVSYDGDEGWEGSNRGIGRGRYRGRGDRGSYAGEDMQQETVEYDCVRDRLAPLGRERGRGRRSRGRGRGRGNGDGTKEAS